MNNRISPLMFAIAISCVSLGCSQINTSPLSQTSDTPQDNQRINIDRSQTADLKWLFYADPKADANLAIEKQNFTLLAFAGRATAFPGIDGESSTLQQQCGYRLLANSSDDLRSEKELRLRKQLYQYAATFNQLVSAACQKNN
jgi:hypothetical protein